jgi:glycosyltransferase involved in cell wall biosynthesis
MAVVNHPLHERCLTLVASDVAPIGGMERVAFELVSRLLRRGWQVTVIARTCSLPPHERLRFVRIPSPSRPVSAALLCDFIFGALALRRHRSGLVQTNNPVLPASVDVIHAHFCEAAYRRRVGLSRSRSPSIAYRLNSWLTSAIALVCERWCYRPGRVRRVVCVSTGLGREIAEAYPSVAPVLRTIPNGVDRETFHAREDERATIRAQLGVRDGEGLALFVGGDWHRKGLRYAIEGLAAATGWRLAVLGNGDPTVFSELASRLGAGDRLAFVGNVQDPARYYSAADAFLLPSHYEAAPMVGLEAAAAGVPLVVPRLNGIEDYLEDGVNGFFTERDGAAIARRLRELRDDPHRRAAMSAAAERTAARFDWSRIVDQWEALYAELGEAG